MKIGPISNDRVNFLMDDCFLGHTCATRLGIVVGFSSFGVLLRLNLPSGIVEESAAVGFSNSSYEEGGVASPISISELLCR